MSPWTETSSIDPITDEKRREISFATDDGHTVRLGRLLKGAPHLEVEVVQPGGDPGGFVSPVLVRVDRRAIHEFDTGRAGEVVHSTVRRIRLAAPFATDEHPPHPLLPDLDSVDRRLVIRYTREKDGEVVDLVIEDVRSLEQLVGRVIPLR